MKVIMIRKGIEDVDNTTGLVFKTLDSKDYITVESDHLFLGIENAYNIKYSSKLYAFKVLCNIFKFKKTKYKYIIKVDIDKYCLDIFMGLEELGAVTVNEFYFKHSNILGMHPEEPRWMENERIELNKKKFINYLKRNEYIDMV